MTTTSQGLILHVDRNCYRGPRPPDLKILEDYKITTIIDLEDGIYEMINGVTQFPPDYGMAYYHMPCSDIFPPRDAYVSKALTMMAQVNRRSYVHCLSGVDRTGYVCAAYRVCVQKWPVDAAIKEWVDIGRHPWFFWWEHSFKKFVNKYGEAT